MNPKTQRATTDRAREAGREEPKDRPSEPASALAELLGKTKQQLLDLAGELKLKGLSKLAKSELARRVHAAREKLHEVAAAAMQKRERPPAPERASAPERPPEAPPKAERHPSPATKPEGPRPPSSEERARRAADRPPPAAAQVPEAAAPARVTTQPADTRPAPAPHTAPTPAAAPPAAPAAQPAPGSVPAERPSPAAAARLDLGPGGAAEPRQDHIPWSYGQDRVTAMAVDPDSLYVYWEVTDPAMDRARASLGAEGTAAWLDLRIYDITGLLFDGTNAHSFFDHGLGRSDRQWFFHVGKPSSSAVVEIGMRAPSGAFARMARSSRVDFPRSSPAPWSEPEWMTVLAGGEVMAAGRGAPARTGGAPASGPGQAAPGAGQPRFEHVPMWVLLEPGEGERRFQELFGEAFERLEWQEAHGEGWYELQGRLEWQVGPMVTSWEAGPFSYPVQVEPPSRTSWEGGAIAYTANGVTRVVYGPWQVVIRNLGGRAERAVLGRWQIFRSWTTQGGLEEVQRMATGTGAPGGASERSAASAWLWQAGSETRLGGASELWRLGASEVRLGGASEVIAAGGSERRLAGASERRMAGASEWRLGGASERRMAGASERRLAGASERRLAGASERRLGGASERKLAGASEGRLGASEHRLEHGDDPSEDTTEWPGWPGKE